MSDFYLNIAVDTPLSCIFDYLPIAHSRRSTYIIGQRVVVPFGRQQKTGVILDVTTESSFDKKKLKTIHKLLDEQPLLCEQDIKLYKWAAHYYHHPIGEVFAQALPKQLRNTAAPAITLAKRYTLSPTGHALKQSDLKRSPRQAALREFLSQYEHPVDDDIFSALDWNWKPVLKSLLAKGWVIVSEESPAPTAQASTPTFSPNLAQQEAINAINKSHNSFKIFLLDGVTGSGKTEVYLQTIQSVLEKGLQVLVLLPEITLTPQLSERFKKRLAAQLVISHSGLSDTQRAQAWLRLKEGFTSILLGTRSAVFTPMKNPGLIILDEEHDTSFKQQEGFRYSARDVAIMRARNYNIPIILGSATPSLESLHNVQNKRFTSLRLPERTAGASHPNIHLIDCRNQQLDNHLSKTLIKAIRKTLERSEQVILFVNRRGFAPVLMCHGCGWVGQCQRCDSRMVIHKQINLLRCHHCGVEHLVPTHCPDCQQPELFPLGLGTQRVEDTLMTLFPNTPITRIDRDSTRRKDAMQVVIDKVNEGDSQILVGTQMLAKGHHFPNVTLVAMVDIDAGLFSCDFRASERMSQLITQVAGRAGREEKKGLVLIQTHHPEHPLLNTLVHRGYAPFAQEALIERQQAQLPPYHHQALLRVNAINESDVLLFLNEVGKSIAAVNTQNISVLGPVPAPMLKRAGRYRYQILFETPQRKPLHLFLSELLPAIGKLKRSRHVRWSIDIDPVDLY